jgi:Holliday junction resolvasome RuvABC endonuclease subunit
MVMLELGLKELDEGVDASDALAVALCHLHATEAAQRLARGAR